MLLTPTPRFRALRRAARAGLGIVVLAGALVAPAGVAAATPTTTTLSAVQSTIVAGDTVALNAAVTPGPGGGTVTFTSSQHGLLGTAEVDPETNVAGISPTLAPGVHTITATFNGFGDFTPSTSAPVTVTASVGTTGGTPTSTRVSLAATGASEGQLIQIRATVTPAPDDGRVQFMEGNRLLGTAPIDVATGQAILSISTLAAGTHQIVAIYTGSANFAGSASPPTPISIAADATVEASGLSVSHATIYPVTDGVGDFVTIRGRTSERASITIAIVSSTGKRYRAFGLGTLTGAYSVAWNGRTSSGAIVPAGRYTVVQTLTDMRGNRLVVSTPLTVSLKQLFTMTDVQTRSGAGFTREGANGFGLVIPRIGEGGDDSVHVWGNVSPDWAFVTYEFTVPSATRYRTVRFEVVGEAQSGRSGALIAVLDASGEPVAEVKTGTANGRYAVVGGPTAVNARRVIATVTANGADKGALRVFSVRLVTTYQVFR